MAGFTAPLVCKRVPVSHLVLLNAMIPSPGETPGEWWDNTGGVPPDVTVRLWAHARGQSAGTS